ncbi:uncharacterized protein LOC143009556 [Genypterus blacodes]|uniref:uncharacterized protein LOC143009556 n=1 Tax=Genypterus blacodes TaxID=154954 RepID=UPI003F771575
MENSQSRPDHRQKITFKEEFSQDFNSDGCFKSHCQTSGEEAAAFPHQRLVLLGLGLLNAALLIAAVVIGIQCARSTDSSLLISRAAATPFLVEFSYLRTNLSGVIQARDEAQRTLQEEIKKRVKIEQQTEQQKVVNDGLHLQIEVLRLGRTKLRSNKTLMEQSCGRCLPGWRFLNGTCYFHSYAESDDKKNWHDSREDCISRGADLVVIDDWEEQQTLNDHFLAPAHTQVWWEVGFWIGLTDEEREGTWVWINNVTQEEPLYWIDGEPNNHGVQGENCAAFYSSGNPRKTWYDGKCHHHHFYWMCETAPR